MNLFQKNALRISMNVFFFLSMATLALATGEVPTLEVSTTTSAKKVSLKVKDLSIASKAVITLRDAKKTILLEEKVAGIASYGKILNLEELPEGKYELSISTPTREIIQPVELTDDKVVVNATLQRTIFHPIINIKADYVDISWLGQQINTVTVEILNEAGGSVFKEKVTNVIKVEKRYDISKLRNGAYYVKVATPHKSYFERLVIR